MKIKLLLCIVFFTTLTLLGISCSDSNDNEDPAGTTTINMMNEGNGKTLLGNSDVYIDNANNFYGRTCLMSSLGKKDGLWSVPSTPVLVGATDRVAVEPGNAYQIFRADAERVFPSGNSALSILADYYNIYVVSQISKSEEVIGATVKFALMDIPDYGLPAYESNIGHLSSMGDELIIDLSSSDFEYTPINEEQPLEYIKEGNKLVVRLAAGQIQRDNFGIYIRIRESYTSVFGTYGPW